MTRFASTHRVAVFGMRHYGGSGRRVVVGRAPSPPLLLPCFSGRLRPAFRQSLMPLLRNFSSSKYPSHEMLLLPALSPTMETGALSEWLAEEGQRLAAGDVVASIETDKAVVDFETQVEFILAKKLVPEGASNLPVGAEIGIMVDNEEDVAAFKDYQVEASDAAAGKQQPTTPPPTATAAGTETASSTPAPASNAVDLPDHEILDFPALSPTMESGALVSWSLSEGDEVSSGDILAEIETDKSVMEWEATEPGFLAKILVPGGTSNLEVGKPVAVLVENESDIEAFKSFTVDNVTSAATATQEAPKAAASKETSPAASATSQPPSAAAASSLPASTSSSFIAASPFAKKIAHQENVRLNQIKGSGAHGRIIAQDVFEAVEQGVGAAGTSFASASSFSPPSSSSSTPAYFDIPHSNIRRVIAQRLTASKQEVPHYYLSMDCTVDALLALRRRVNDRAAGSYKLSVNDFVIRAACAAMNDVPVVNSAWHDDFVRQYSHVDVNVAVSTERGLLTPLIRDAGSLSLRQISQQSQQLAQLARDAKLAPELMQPGTFTISNLGMFGISHFTAVINPPQACILAVGAAKPSVSDPQNSLSMTVTLSCDHRVVDGAIGAQWLQAFKNYIEDPATMLV